MIVPSGALLLNNSRADVQEAFEKKKFFVKFANNWAEKRDAMAKMLGYFDNTVPSAALLDQANLTGLVLGCIETKFCKKICV